VCLKPPSTLREFWKFLVRGFQKFLAISKSQAHFLAGPYLSRGLRGKSPIAELEKKNATSIPV